MDLRKTIRPSMLKGASPGSLFSFSFDEELHWGLRLECNVYVLDLGSGPRSAHVDVLNFGAGDGDIVAVIEDACEVVPSLPGGLCQMTMGRKLQFKSGALVVDGRHRAYIGCGTRNNRTYFNIATGKAEMPASGELLAFNEWRIVRRTPAGEETLLTMDVNQAL
jgi:hypothetical protein